MWKPFAESFDCILSWSSSLKCICINGAVQEQSILFSLWLHVAGLVCMWKDKKLKHVGLVLTVIAPPAQVFLVWYILNSLQFPQQMKMAGFIVYLNCSYNKEDRMSSLLLLLTVNLMLSIDSVAFVCNAVNRQTWARNSLC